MTKGQVKSLIGLLAAYAAMFFTGYQVGNLVTIRKAKKNVNGLKDYYESNENFWNDEVSDYELKAEMAETPEMERYYKEIVRFRMQQRREAELKKETCDAIRQKIEYFC